MFTGKIVLKFVVTLPLKMAYKYIDNYREQGARKRLVDVLRKKGIGDEHVLEAIGKVKRHCFFDETFWNQAYRDIAFPIGEGQTI